MANITYLLGAGASALRLPTVAKLPEAIMEVRKLIIERGNLETAEQVIFTEKLDWLHSECLDHASVDTFARKLYLTKQFEKLNNLKALLDFFFVIYQSSKNIDPRYEAFLAAILSSGVNSEIILPKKFNIISWNYDIQFELAANNFYNFEDVNQLERKLNIFPNTINNYNYDIDGFNVVKLNGTSGGLISKSQFKRKEFLDIFRYDESERLKQAINNYNSTLQSEEYNSSILFAWEKNKVTNNSRDVAINIFRDTQILVVIGYSFPTFNRDIDKQLLNSMGSQLTKIVIQSPQETVNDVELRLKSLVNFPINSIIKKNTDKNEFFIPFEF